MKSATTTFFSLASDFSRRHALSGMLLQLILWHEHLAVLLDEEPALRVVGVDDGVLLEPKHHGFLARIVLVILISGDHRAFHVDAEGSIPPKLDTFFTSSTSVGSGGVSSKSARNEVHASVMLNAASLAKDRN